MKKFTNFISIIIVTMLFNACGDGGDSASDKEVKKDKSYYKQELEKRTRLEALHSDKSVLFTLESLESTLNELTDFNETTIKAILFQFYDRLNTQTATGDFILKKDTPILLKKIITSTESNKLEEVSNNLKIMKELDIASKRVINKSISSKLPSNFLERLESASKIDSKKDAKEFISYAPNLPKEIECPSLGPCREVSPIKEWMRKGIAEVSSVNKAYEQELDIISHDKTANNPVGISLSRTWTCPESSFSITATNYTNGTSSVVFSSIGGSLYKVRDFHSFEPFAYGEGFEVMYSPNDNLQQSVCLSDGSWIAGNEKYFIVHKFKTFNTYTTTYAYWHGASHVDGILDFETVNEALNYYRDYLASVTNGTLPSRCTGIPCSNGGIGDGAIIDDIDPMNRVSMHTVAMSSPEASAQDILDFFRGDTWGTHVEDLNGLSVNMATTLENLGYINGRAITQNIINNFNSVNDDGYRFIFRRLDTSSETIDLWPVEEDEEIKLFVTPKLKEVAPNSGGYPTNMFYNTKQVRALMPGGTPNPGYCKELDYKSSSYIPIYMYDPKVLLELNEDIEYLTGEQLDNLENQKNILMWDKYFNVTNSRYGVNYLYYGYQEASGLIYPARKEYACSKNGPMCPKDEAYYDALIDRVIILNPILNGNKFNHPCLQPNKVASSWLTPSSSF